jgi:hypothetical protein
MPEAAQNSVREPAECGIRRVLPATMFEASPGQSAEIGWAIWTMLPKGSGAAERHRR